MIRWDDLTWTPLRADTGIKLLIRKDKICEKRGDKATLHIYIYIYISIIMFKKDVRKRSGK
jgi:hypothetical protein